MILTIILPFKGLSYIYGVVITTFSKEYTKLYIQILIALVSIGLNIIFVSQYGIIASCWISVFSLPRSLLDEPILKFPGLIQTISNVTPLSN